MQSVYDNETVQYRLKYVLEMKHRDKSISQDAEDAQVDWKTMKSWITWFDQEGIKGLLNKPRGNSLTVPDIVADKIIDVGKKIHIEAQNESEILFGRMRMFHFIVRLSGEP